MAYRRYIKRGDKLYGPYIYHSRKEDGKVISEYLGRSNVTKKSSKIFFALFALFGFSVLFFLIYFLNTTLTGNIILQVDDSYSDGKDLKGYFSFVLEKEEFIPASTKILVNSSGEIYEFPLSEFIEQPSEGEFYVKGTNISGKGLGYGAEANVVNFVLRIYNEEEINETSGEETEKEPEENITEINQTFVNETEILENETAEVNQTGTEEINITEQTNETLSEPQENESSEINKETESNESEIQEEENISEGAGITGSVIGGLAKIPSKLFFTITGHSISGINIEGQISKGEKFIYNISKGQNAEIVSSSNDVNLVVENNQVILTTDYTSDEREIIINLENLEVPAREGKLIVSLVYGGTEMAFFEKEISITNKSVVLNKTDIITENLSEIVGKRTKKQFKAIIHRPVKWIEIINTTNKSIKIEVPKKASNITIKKGEEVSDSLRELKEYEDRIKETDRKEFVRNTDISLGKEAGFLTGAFSRAAITGKAISEEQIEENITETGEKKIIEINTENESIGIEYYTEAPSAIEEEIENGKRIIISAPDELGYTDVLAYTELPEEVSEGSIKVYNIDNGSKTETGFDAYDLDDDGYVDYVEWIVPHLSTQIYEVIIEVSKAEHLDKDKTFISDITEEVEKLDGLWSENIRNEEYVRVYFRENLTSENDITLFARTANYTGNSSVEIYAENEKIAVIESINNGAYYKTYLQDLSESTNVFDLKIVSDSGIEFDYIVDPALVVVIDDSDDYLYMQNRTEASPHGARLEAPVLFMDFNEENESTYVIDKSAYNNYGTISGNPVYNALCASPIGDGGGCYEFDGGDEYIGFSDSSSLDIAGKEVTVSFWMRPNADASSADTGLVIKGGLAYGCTYHTNDVWCYINGGGNSAHAYNLVPNTWYHIVQTFNGSFIAVYENGVISEISSLSASLNNGGALKIGQLSNTFNGSIDHVQIWDRALEAWEIQQLYNGTYNASEYAGKYARTGNFSSFVYYNGSAVYWNITTSTADSDGRGLNLSNPNLVSYLALDGNYRDSKGSSHGSCTIGQCPHNSTGLSSGAMLFDGSDDAVDCGSDGSLNFGNFTNFTVAYWFKTSGDADTYEYFVHRINDAGFQTYINPSNYMVMHVRDKEGNEIYPNTQVSITDNEWHHFVGSADRNGNLQIYLDNVARGSSSMAGIGNITNTSSSLGIGANGSSTTLSGSIDEIVIYNKSLTASEIDDLYKVGLSQHADTNLTLFVRTASGYNLSDSSLVSFWSFNDENAVDEMGRNNGTVYGATWMQQGGVVGGGYNFSDDDYIEVGESAELNPSILSIEFWFKPDSDYDSGTDYVSLISHTYYEIYIDNGYMVFEYEGSKINSSTSTWNNEQWYHIFATYDGNVQTLYINSMNESSAVAELSAPFRIKNSIGTNLASFFNSGNLILKGKCFAMADCTSPSDGSFIIETSGATVAYVNSTGDLCIEDANCNDNDANCNNPGDGSFIIRNSTLDNVAYINSTGNLCLTRTLTENGNP